MEWRSIHSNSQLAPCHMLVAHSSLLRVKRAMQLTSTWLGTKVLTCFGIEIIGTYWDLNGLNFMPQRHAQRFSTFQHCSVACWGIFRQCRLFACNVWACLWEAYQLILSISPGRIIRTPLRATLSWPWTQCQLRHFLKIHFRISHFVFLNMWTFMCERVKHIDRSGSKEFPASGSIRSRNMDSLETWNSRNVASSPKGSWKIRS